jgi:uncharacterized protein YhaN
MMPKAEIVIDVAYDRAPQLALAQRVPELSEQLSTCQIKDQVSLNRANEAIVAGVEWLKAVDRIMDPVREATHRAWKSAIAAQDEFKAPVERPLKVLKGLASKYLADVEAEKQRKQREADEEQRRKNEADARSMAADLKRMGASKQEIADVKQEIKATPAATVQAEAAAPSGMSSRMLYSAEVTDLKAFLTHLVSDQYLLTLFGYSGAFKKAIESELRGEAGKRKDGYSIPGTKLVKTPSGAWR